MDGYLKQSTAYTLKIGKYVDSTDGVTVEDGLTIAQADVRLSKNGGAFAQKNSVTGCTHDEGGWYGCPINTTDTGTLGLLKLDATVAGACPVYHTYMVVRADWYDTMCGTDYLQVDVIQVGSSTQSEIDLKDFVDTGYDPSTHKVAGLSDTAIAAAVDAVWNEDATDHTTADSTGENLNVINDMLTGKKTVVGTTMTHYKQDGSTPRKTFTLNDATNASSRTPT